MEPGDSNLLCFNLWLSHLDFMIALTEPRGGDSQNKSTENSIFSIEVQGIQFSPYNA